MDYSRELQCVKFGHLRRQLYTPIEIWDIDSNTDMAYVEIQTSMH